MIPSPSPERQPRSADFGSHRRQIVLSMLRDPDFTAADPDDDARLLYTISALICNDAGVFTDGDLDAALADPSVTQYARHLLRKAAER
jgi:hypothetical protein